MINVIGAGLGGAEAALQLSDRGEEVNLYEAKPLWKSAAHTSNDFAEVVCSNSFKSELYGTAGGMLKNELGILGSHLLEIARSHSVPAGGALAVNREEFSAAVTREIRSRKNINVISENLSRIPDGVTVIAAGPLVSDELAATLKEKGFLHFYDAAAPIITAESVDRSSAFFGSRYGKGGDDYINCPMTKSEYEEFYNALVTAECVELRDFEKREIFEGCMPIEVMAKRGVKSLLFGPLRPVGFTVDGKRPYALVQLRFENEQKTLCNPVGFQTNLKFGEQKRVFSMIPALKNAEFVRYGVMHRNSYLDAPKTLSLDLSFKSDASKFVVGQLSGVEGYVESIATGLLGAVNAYNFNHGLPPLELPNTSMLGALTRYITTPNANFQPMNANFGILPPIDVRDKTARKGAYYDRGDRDLKAYLDEIGFTPREKSKNG